jgi:hypothetical protein
MSQGSNERYVPSGVNAESWLGFEQRIQERRFRALLDTMNQALAVSDVSGARVAFDEARELRPDAPELADVELRLSAIPGAIPDDAPGPARSRAVSAVMLLLFGIALLMGIDWMRSAGSNVMPPPMIAAPTPQPQGATSATEETQPEQAPVTIVPPPSVEDLVAPAPVATAGAEASYRSASTLQPRATTANGETPDDFVFRPVRPAARRSQVAGSPSRQPQSPSQPLTSNQLPPSRLAATPAPAAPVPLAPVASVPPVITRREPADENRVAAVLNEYARAYGALDAGAAREVWPTVNERALARAFAGLSSQDVEFDDCAIDVRGTTANASCRGKASYVGKIGSGAPRTEARTWHFELRRDGEAWKIETAEARRQ